MAQHTFHLKADWTGGRNGEGRITVGNLSSAISAPAELDGPGIGTNPEEMLVGSAATCYIITLAALLNKREIPVAKLTMSSEGVVSKQGGLHFERIVHRPQMTLTSGATEEQQEAAKQAAIRAEQACMISNTLRGNVEVHVEPVVTVNL